MAKEQQFQLWFLGRSGTWTHFGVPSDRESRERTEKTVTNYPGVTETCILPVSQHPLDAKREVTA